MGEWVRKMNDQTDHKDGKTPADGKSAKVSKAKPKRKLVGWFGRVVSFLIVVTVAGAGSVAAYIYWSQNYVLSSSVPDHSREISDLESTIANSEIKLATLSQELKEFSDLLETRLNEQERTQSRKDLRLSGELSTLREQLENLRLNYSNSPDSEIIDEIVTRLDRIEQLPLTGGGDSNQLALAGMQDRFDSVEKTVVAFGFEIDQIKSLRTQIEENVRAIDEMRSEFRSELNALRTAKGSLKQGNVADTTVVHSDVALAIVSIESMSRRGEPFPIQYAKLEQAVPDHPALLTLKPFSSGGVVTFTEIQTEFEKAQSIVLANALKPATNDLNWLKKVFGDGVRIKADISESSMVERLTLASELLDSGNLVASLEILKEYPDPAFENWVTLAQDRVNLETSIDLLRQDLINAQR